MLSMSSRLPAVFQTTGNTLWGVNPTFASTKLTSSVNGFVLLGQETPARYSSWPLLSRLESLTPRKLAVICTLMIWNSAANWTCGASNLNLLVYQRTLQQHWLPPSSATKSHWYLEVLRAAVLRQFFAVYLVRMVSWKTSWRAESHCLICWGRWPASTLESCLRRSASSLAG